MRSRANIFHQLGWCQGCRREQREHCCHSFQQSRPHQTHGRAGSFQASALNTTSIIIPSKRLLGEFAHGVLGDVEVRRRLLGLGLPPATFSPG